MFNDFKAVPLHVILSRLHEGLEGTGGVEVRYGTVLSELDPQKR